MTTSPPAGTPEALFNVRDVAVVGASPGKHYSSSLISNLLAHGVPAERLHLVNPRYETVQGLPCYPDLDRLPVRPSLAVSLVGTSQVEAVLDRIIACAVPAALVIADGFAESDGEGVQRQHQLAEKAANHGLALLGPNSLGYTVPSRGIGAWVGGVLPPELRAGRLALVFQSSGMLNLIMAQVAQRRIGVSAAVSVGNEAVLDLADFVHYVAADDTTDVIGIVAESTIRPRALASALLAARAAGKLLVVLSIGKSERGRRNAASHAGRMATTAHVWQALYRQVGAIVVDDLADFVETVAVATGLPREANPQRLAIATISGGDCGLLSDLADTLDVTLAEVTPTTQATLDSALSRTGILANPLDLRNTRTSAPSAFWTSVDALAADPHVDIVALRMNFAGEPTPAHVETYTQLAERVRAAGSSCVYLSRVPEVHSPAWYDLFASLETPFLTSYGGALRAFAHLQRHAAQQSMVELHTTFDSVPTQPQPLEAGSALSWQHTQQWLREQHIPYVPSRLAASVEQAVAHAEDLGFPVALKGIVAGVAHKTEHRLVELGVRSTDMAAEAAHRLWQRMASLTGGHCTDCAIEVQAMVDNEVEFFLGAHRDPLLGPIVSCGLGGIFLEILGDVAHAVPPITPQQATSLLSTLSGWPVLTGARGRAPRDVAALADLISRFSTAIATQANWIMALDLNPVMVLPAGQGVLSTDAFCQRVLSTH